MSDDEAAEVVRVCRIIGFGVKSSEEILRNYKPGEHIEVTKDNIDAVIEQRHLDSALEDELVRQAAEAEKRPTAKLKWCLVGESRSPVAITYSWEDYTYHVLKQWWEDATGKGEWREIEYER